VPHHTTRAIEAGYALCVPCLHCGSGIGVPCIQKNGRESLSPHVARERSLVAREAAEQKARVKEAAAVKRQQEGPIETPVTEKRRAWASAPPRGPFPSRLATPEEAQQLEDECRRSFFADRFYPTGGLTCP
jgi:hypothetical protein